MVKRLLAALVAGTTAAALLAGCGGGDAPPAASPPSGTTTSPASASTSPTPSPTTPPATSPTASPTTTSRPVAMPPAAKAHTKAGAEAFVRAYFAEVNHAWTHSVHRRDSASYAKPTCKSCARVSPPPSDLVLKQQRYDGNASHPPDHVVCEPSADRPVPGRRSRTVQEKRNVVDDSGKVVLTDPQDSRLGFDGRAGLAQRQWLIETIRRSHEAATAWRAPPSLPRCLFLPLPSADRLSAETCRRWRRHRATR